MALVRVMGVPAQYRGKIVKMSKGRNSKKRLNLICYIKFILYLCIVKGSLSKI